MRLISLLLLAATAGCARGDLLSDSSCLTPAPLLGTTDARAPGYIVVFRDGTDVDATVAGLTSRYELQVRHVYKHALLGFAAELNPVQLDGVRCEPRVKYVEHDGAIQVGGEK